LPYAGSHGLMRSGATRARRGQERGGFARWARSGDSARLEKEIIFLFIFQITEHTILILSKIKAFSRFGTKTKVVPNFMLHNFAKRSKVKFQIDFELEN
jgi:hypothetical protein